MFLILLRSNTLHFSFVVDHTFGAKYKNLEIFVPGYFFLSFIVLRFIFKSVAHLYLFSKVSKSGAK